MATLLDRYQGGLANVRTRVSAGVGHAWDSLPAYYPENVEEFLALAGPLVEGGQRAAVSLTDAYLGARLGTGPAGVDLDTLRLRGGVTPEEVYRRPFVNVWTALSRGERPPAAIASGRARALSASEMDVALATRDAAHARLSADERVVGYARVPDGGACSFCLLVSTQRYHVEDLMPLHNRCGCTVDPIIGNRDPGHVIAPERLQAIKADGVSAKIEDHGELGPLVVDARSTFTGPEDLD